MKLGDKVKDTVTGFTGIVVTRAEHLNGCIRFGVQSDKLKDGIPSDAQWFDEPQLVLVKPAAVKRGPSETGGPLPFTPKRSVDSR